MRAPRISLVCSNSRNAHVRLEKIATVLNQFSLVTLHVNVTPTFANELGIAVGDPFRLPEETNAVYFLHAHSYADFEISLANDAISKRVPIIFDTYDPMCLYGNGETSQTLLNKERLFFQISSAICWKFDSELIEIFENKYDRKIEHRFQLFDYCLAKYFSYPDHTEMDSVVYTGGSSGELNCDAQSVNCDGYHVPHFLKLLEQGLRVSYFPNNFPTIDSIVKNFPVSTNLSLGAYYGKYHLRPPIPQGNLQDEIKNFAYGLMLHNFHSTKYAFGRYSTGNKLFSYLESGLPIIVSSEQKTPCEIVTEHKIGHVVDLRQENWADKFKPGLYDDELKQNVLRKRATDLNLLTTTPALKNFIYKLI